MILTGLKSCFVSRGRGVVDLVLHAAEILSRIHVPKNSLQLKQLFYRRHSWTWFNSQQIKKCFFVGKQVKYMLQCCWSVRQVKHGCSSPVAWSTWDTISTNAWDDFKVTASFFARKWKDPQNLTYYLETFMLKNGVHEAKPSGLSFSVNWFCFEWIMY